MLVERDRELAVLDELVSAAQSGHGHLVMVGGEAGVGKTTLISALTASAHERVTVRRGTVDTIPTAEALGPLADAVPELAELLDAGTSRLTIFRRAAAVLSATPTLLVVEDVHWADGATLDLLRYLGRRIADLPLLVVATYRDDEVSARHPLSLVLGELTGSPSVIRLGLLPLSAEGVRTLVRSAGATSVDPVELHGRTGGNPFYVTELLSGTGAELPTTVRDAVLARTARLGPAAQDALSAAAVIGRPADIDLVISVAQCTGDAVDECVTSGALVAIGTQLAFRHELARLAVEQSVPPASRASLHARALQELLLRDGNDHRFLAHHAAASGNWDVVALHAPAAAERAGRLGAHRQAAEQYRTALRVPGLVAVERGRLYEALSFECYVTEQTEEALVSRQQAMELFELAGDHERVGAAQRWLSRLSWFLGRNADAERYALRAIETLESLPEGRELAMAYSNLAQLRALSHDAAPAVEWGERALELARRIGDREVQAHALNNIGTALDLLGRPSDARQQLNRSLEMAMTDDAHEHVARAYTNIGFRSYAARRLSEAEHLLRTGLAYCEARDLDSWTRYMSAVLVSVLTEAGRYAEAVDVADPLLAHPQLAPISRIPAAAARGRIAAQCGATDHWLDEAEAAALLTGESQRLVPVAAARAEVAWLAGGADRAARIVAAVDLAWTTAIARPDPWELGELSWWLAVAGQRRAIPIEPSEPFGLMLAGQMSAAAEAWRAIGAPLWTARALGADPQLAAAREAVDIATALGASAVRDAIVRDRHEAGLPVPRAVRATTRSDGTGLTAREVDVLQLLADGLSNAEVAGRLFLSERTVAHHVSAVLRKTGETSRGRAVAAARREGILPQT